MQPKNFNNIPFYFEINPHLNPEELSILLLIEELYNDAPSDIAQFRQNYVHLDPNIIDTFAEGITFLKIAHKNFPNDQIKDALNSYLNTKYNYLGTPKTYKENMKRFQTHSQIISRVINDVLHRSGIPTAMIGILEEKESVRECHDIIELLNLYKKNKKLRVKFEILRKIGLNVLLARINKSFLISDVDRNLNEVLRLLHNGLHLEASNEKLFYFWVDENGKVIFRTDKDEAKKLYANTFEKRQKLILPIYPLETFSAIPKYSIFDSAIYHIELRNKLRDNDQLSYTSFIEKMIRKNYEFPNQIRDVIGLKVVVDNEGQIFNLIEGFETFLGGSSTRKQEKNSLHKFGKKKLSKYSSDEYFVWKAVYDLTLPHPFLQSLDKMMALSRTNLSLQEELTQKKHFFMERPQDVVVEIQVQDINSFLQSIAVGSSSHHSVLKMNQIRSNSFYKLFPKEIYESELFALRNQILRPVAC